MTANSYKAWVYRQSGDTYQLTLEARPTAPLTAHQVRIQVEAVSLNYRDWIALNNLAGRKVDGRVACSDGTGKVVEVGSEVTSVQVGDRVAGCFFQGWEDGKFDMRHHRSDLGGTIDGMLAEQVTLEESGVVVVPSYLTAEEASTLPCAAVTAWQALYRRGNLQPGESILALGTGGVSVFAAQMGLASGAQVALTSSSHTKIERAVQLGVHHTVNYRDNVDWEKSILEWTGNQGVDHVIETGGPGTLEKSMACVAPSGQIALIGVLTGFGPPSTSLFPLLAKNVRLDGIYVGSRNDFRMMNAFLGQHQIHPVIDQVFPFQEAKQAFAHLGNGKHFGKVVIAFS